MDYETASMVKLYTTESINRNVTKASFLIFFKFVLAEIPKTHYSYCNYGVVGVTCGNTPSQKHSLVLASKLFMLVLLKSCANLSQEVFIHVELNKLTKNWNFEKPLKLKLHCTLRHEKILKCLLSPIPTYFGLTRHNFSRWF